MPLEVLVNKFSHMRFEPMGHTTNPDIRIAKSVVDYIFRWMGITFLPGYREANQSIGGPTPGVAPTSSEPTAKPGEPQTPSSAPRTGEPPASAGGYGGATASATKSAPSARREPGGTPTGLNGTQANGHPSGETSAKVLERAGATRYDSAAGLSATNQQFANFQVDAPPCDVCGNITVRAGNCYLCHNCGHSMGCS